MLEIFPKLCGLDGLEVNNLRKKEGNEWTELIMDNLIKNHIKQKDKIYFDLKFNNIWIDIIMTIKDDNNKTNSNKFSFELKTDLKRNNTELELSLINLGIRSWRQFNEEDEDYYLLSNIEIKSENEYNSKQNENNQNNLDEKLKNSDNKFNFNDKIICTLIFINFSDYIYKYALKEVEEKKKNEIVENFYGEKPFEYMYKSYEFNEFERKSKSRDSDKKMIEIKKYFNNNFEKLYLCKNENKKVIEEEKIICKVSQNYFNEEEENSCLVDFDYNSPPNNHNIEVKHIGPFDKKMFTERKRIPMNEIKNTEKISFKNNIKNRESDSSSSLNNNNSKENSFNSSNNYIENFQYRYNENYNNDIEEIKFIENEINFDNIFDQITTYILSKKFNESDIYKTRNLIYLDGEKLKNNRNNLDKDEVDKNNSKDIKNTRLSNENDYYNISLIKKYSIIFIIIMLILIVYNLN